MSKMILFEPLPMVALTDVYGNLSGESNLLTPSPKEVALHPSEVGNGRIGIDLGSAKSIDCIFIGFHNYRADGGTDIYGGVAAPMETLLGNGSLRAPSSHAAPPRRHFFAKLAAPVVSRYIDIWLYRPDAYNATIGIVAIGLALPIEHNREKGGGRTIIDTGTAEPLADGGFGIGEGTRKAGFRWVFGDLSDAELEALYGLALDRGNTRPLVVVEDPDATTGLNERIHYSLFDKFEHYERGDPTKHRWALSVTQWV